MTASFTSLEPEPAEWFTLERFEKLKATVDNNYTLLKQSGLLRPFIGYWVRSEVSLSYNWTSEEEKKVLTPLVDKFEAENPNHTYPQALLLAKVRVRPASFSWAAEKWSYKVDSIYLEKKNELDQASCLFMRHSDKNLLLEIYHQIKAGEKTFQELACQYAQGPEKNYSGMISMRPLNKIPFGLAPLLRTMEEDKLTMPLPFGKGFCIAKLLEYKPSTLDQKTKDILIDNMLQVWVDLVIDHIIESFETTASRS